MSKSRTNNRNKAEWQGEYLDISTDIILPAEVWDQVNKNLSLREQCLFAMTCKGAYALGYVSTNINTFYNHYIRTYRIEIQKQVNELLIFVVRGDQKQAEIIIKKNPHLLLETGTVMDYSGRVIEGTALNIALGAEDVQYLKSEECMVEMITRYLRQFPNYKDILRKQIEAQFPDGWEKIEEEKLSKDLIMLDKVIKVICNSNSIHSVLLALQEFKDYLEPKEKIKIGKHFNMDFLVKSIETYIKLYLNCKTKEKDKSQQIFELIWGRVIGQIQRYVPACYAQAICQDITTIMKGTNLKRSFRFKSEMGYSSFFPLDLNFYEKLGANSAAKITSGELIRSYLIVDLEDLNNFQSFKKYVKEKKLTTKLFIEQTIQPKNNFCHIM